MAEIVAASTLGVDSEGRREFGDSAAHDFVNPEIAVANTYPANIGVDDKDARLVVIEEIDRGDTMGVDQER